MTARPRPRLTCKHHGCTETAVCMKDGEPLGYLCPRHSVTGGPMFFTRPAYAPPADDPSAPVPRPTLTIDDEET